MDEDVQLKSFLFVFLESRHKKNKKEPLPDNPEGAGGERKENNI